MRMLRVIVEQANEDGLIFRQVIERYQLPDTDDGRSLYHAVVAEAEHWLSGNTDLKE